MNAFNKVVVLYEQIKNDYDLLGFNENSENLISNYHNALNLFESEFEI